MNNKHLIFVVNEFSRNGDAILSKLERVMPLFECTYDVYITKYPEHATELSETLVKEKKQNSLIVAVGGDGTLNEVLKGILNADSIPLTPLAYIPTGSGNDFARSLQLSFNLKESIYKILSTESPTYLDVLIGESNPGNIVAVNSIGVGLDGMVINRLEKNKIKQRIGKFSYLASVISAYFSQKTFSLEILTDKEIFTYKQSLLAVCTNNIFFGGGIPIHPNALSTDGMIDLVIAEKVSFWELLTILFSILTTKNHLQHKKLHSHRVAFCSLTMHPSQYGQYDGELVSQKVGKISVKTIKHPFWI